MLISVSVWAQQQESSQSKAHHVCIALVDLPPLEKMSMIEREVPAFSQILSLRVQGP